MSSKIVRVSDVMNTSVHMIDGLASVRSAIAAMNEHGVSSLVIERRDDDDEFGIVTARSIASGVVADGRSTARTSVYEVMTKPALTLDCEMNTKYAIRMLVQFGQKRALVTRGKELLGIVTLRDMVLGYVEADEAG